VLHANCREVLPALRVDHVICDPPYDSRTHRNAILRHDATGERRGIGFASLAELESLVSLLLVAASRWALAFCALEQLGEYSLAAGDSWIRAGVWDKIAPMPQLTGDRPGQAVEGIAIMHGPAKRRWNRGGGAGIWRFLPVKGASRYGHETPKPEELMMSLVRDFTDPDDVILDPFAGSGTTGAAALRLGRRAILVERDEAHARTCVERMRAEQRGHSLAAERTGQEVLWK
jgi:site-specific DNA-methyltransferase (adenine-specific)